MIPGSVRAATLMSGPRGEGLREEKVAHQVRVLRLELQGARVRIVVDLLVLPWQHFHESAFLV